MDWVNFAAAIVSVSLFCLWGALCVLCVGGWFVHRQKRPPLTQQHELAMSEIPGLTWRDPWWWIFAFFCWPILIALMLDHRWQRGPRGTKDRLH